MTQHIACQSLEIHCSEPLFKSVFPYTPPPLIGGMDIPLFQAVELTDITHHTISIKEFCLFPQSIYFIPTTAMVINPAITTTVNLLVVIQWAGNSLAMRDLYQLLQCDVTLSQDEKCFKVACSEIYKLELGRSYHEASNITAEQIEALCAGKTFDHTLPDRTTTIIDLSNQYDANRRWRYIQQLPINKCCCVIL